jgi:hypothetical protein
VAIIHPYDHLARFGDYKYESMFFWNHPSLFLGIYFWEIRIESANYGQNSNSNFEIWRLFLFKIHIFAILTILPKNQWNLWFWFHLLIFDPVCVCVFLFHQSCDVVEVATIYNLI